MEQKRKDDLRKWFENLEHFQQVDIALECIEELIIFNSIKYDSKEPYWDASGIKLDSSEEC